MPGPQASQMPEFSRVIVVADIPITGLDLELSADHRARQALAVRFGLRGLPMLAASLRVDRLGDGCVDVEGRLRATVEQQCIATLEPVTRQLDVPFTMRFGPAADPSESRDGHPDVVVSVAEADPPEPIVDGRFDLGEAAAQLLAVSVDPYPRAAEALLSAIAAPDDSDAADSPFAALAKLKRSTAPG